MSYKIIYHVGPELTLKTKVKSGTLTLHENSLSIFDSSDLTISYSSITNVEMFRLNGLGRTIKLVCQDRIIFLTVVRLDFFGYFALVNFFKTGKLYEILKKSALGK